MQRKMQYKSQRDWGGVHLHTRGEKIGVFLHVFGAEGAENVFFVAPKALRKCESSDAFGAIFQNEDSSFLTLLGCTKIAGGGGPQIIN